MTAVVPVAAGMALAVSALSPYVVIPWLRRIGSLDVPSDRSLHTDTAVRGVGVGPLLAMVVGFVLVLAGGSTDGALGVAELILVVSVSAVAGILGAAEDIKGLSIRVRAGGQLVVGLAGAAVALAISGSPLWLLPVLAVAIAGYINVANFMDGVNGVSALHGLVVGLTFSFVGATNELGWMAASGLLIAASFIGFLPWNVLKRGTFLGDVGSYLLGGSISIVAVLALAEGVNAVAIVAPISIYLADTGFTLISRIVRGERWTQSHRSHVFQRLTTLGLTHVQSAMVVTVATVATSALGVLALDDSLFSTVVAAAGVSAVAAAYLALPSTIGRRRIPTAANETPVETRSSSAAIAGDDSTSFVPVRWAVLGSTGFIGSSIVSDLVDRGKDVVRISAPRLALDPDANAAAVVKQALANRQLIDELRAQLHGVDVIINAAGLASPDSASNAALFGANALLPVVVAEAASLAHVGRFVHISSAAVQGRRTIIDESPDSAPFSPYSHSKALGEAALLNHAATGTAAAAAEVVIVRATSVQGPERETTQRLQRLARSRFASVARPGDLPTVVSSVGGLVSFVDSVASHPTKLPPIVLQPWEGLTTGETLFLAGGRRPILLPVALCRALVAVGYTIAAALPPVKGLVRRVELMWLGQKQDSSWARAVGLPPVSQVADVLRPRPEGT